MSWYSDKEPFNEWDDPYCVWKSKATHGKCGQTKAECDRCMIEHYKEYDDVRTFCDIYRCEECPRYGDDCDGDPDNMETEDDEIS